jgi:hypothetical protein
MLKIKTYNFKDTCSISRPELVWHHTHVDIEYGGNFAATSPVCKRKHAQAQFIPLQHFSGCVSVEFHNASKVCKWYWKFLLQAWYLIRLNQKTITPLINKAYELYFGCKTSDQDKPWACHIVCANCAVYLRGQKKRSWKSMAFAVPVAWLEQNDHLTDC